VVGRLVNEELFKLPDILKAATDVPENELNMDWFQQLGFLCFVFYTKTPYPEVLKLFIQVGHIILFNSHSSKAILYTLY
jgi:hypothetical protein